MLTISELFIYPIKSLGGIAVSNAYVTDRGLQYDRRWMLVDDNNIFLTQREWPAMALFDVAIKDEGLLVTHKPDGAAMLVPFESQTSEVLTVEVWSDHCKAIVVSHEANAWFSKLLNMNCKLVYMPDAVKRSVDEKYALDKEIVSFADGYPMLLIGQSSLDDLNNKLQEKLTMRRFRPSIVFTGGEPFEEDELKAFTINGIHFFGVKLCARCVITTINPDTATKGKEPLRTLATYRMENNKIYFGQNLLHKGEGWIQVGDAIEVIKRKAATRYFTQDK
ncbi:MOSC domain-containing protein [Ilyomonas limi]|uniref:MOSC domain-containing protein n=2 Tax=Ilyomonas limi TaxID=2575867 RepID=A0A4U3L5E8_9BACT|nr:MOSC domain-containing protein [Ilyomonas limi]